MITTWRGRHIHHPPRDDSQQHASPTMASVSTTRMTKHGAIDGDNGTGTSCWRRQQTLPRVVLTTNVGVCLVTKYRPCVCDNVVVIFAHTHHDMCCHQYHCVLGVVIIGARLSSLCIMRCVCVYVCVIVVLPIASVSLVLSCLSSLPRTLYCACVCRDHRCCARCE